MLCTAPDHMGRCERACCFCKALLPRKSNERPFLYASIPGDSTECWVEAGDPAVHRKLILAMGRAHQRHWFQTRWRDLFSESPWPKRALIAAASCLAADARKHWYNSIESWFDSLELAVMRWAESSSDP